MNYWENVDLYIGGSEHATGHLLYARFWNKFLKDRGFAPTEEPFKKLINQGMILGTSAFLYRVDTTDMKFNKEIDIELLRTYPIFISHNILQNAKNSKKILHSFNEDIKTILKGYYGNDLLDFNLTVGKVHPINVDVSYVNFSDELNVIDFLSDNKYFDYKDAIFISENGKVLSFGEDLGEAFKVGREVEKMSKSKYNVVNPDAICEQYGADSLRLYEMFLGPLEQYKPWNTAGITGVHGFLKKLWKLYVGEDGLNVNDAEPSKEALKTLHKTIKKVEEDIENFSFNTSVSTFMIAVNELTAQKCTSREILEPLLILLSPYAPHIAEELWSKLGHTQSISTAAFPKYDEQYLVESTKNYPVSFNGKMKFTLELPMDLSKDDIEKAVMAHEKTIAQLEGRTPKNIIIVPGKIVNIVG